MELIREAVNFLMPDISKMIISLTIWGSLVILITTVAKFYSILIVRGVSMLPTFHPWEPILIKKNFDLKIGCCYVFDREGMLVVKRLKKINVGRISGTVTLWMEGDNQEESYDSRDYGFIYENQLIGEVVKIWGNKNERNDHT